ncbi:MAG: hypothetical protein F4121_10765 [Acidimicrobiia bacterium]|nr:hypothetical protein [Acidimicrobiia bacterium]MYC46021.1 hypothetical protein [Acidimicrobiia bacterium]MYI20525.1 hypothetical protein [Acidimicrobiia bacterium]
MRKEARLLRNKAVDSLVLSIEFFNRPVERARADSVLILMDHAFEMLLKASIVHRGGRIRERRAKQTIGFDACVRRGLSDGERRFLSEEQALTLQTINALRDAAHHYLLEISEQQLYLHTQAGVTLFADLLESVFDESLSDHLPDRVLPVTANPPQELDLLVASEVEQISALLEPGRRRRVEARSQARGLAIMEGSINGERLQPSNGELDKILDQIGSGRHWREIFPGIAALRLDLDGGGIPFSLRIVKGEDTTPIRAVSAMEEPNAAVVALKRVNELDFYSLGLQDLANKTGVGRNKLLTVIQELDLQSDPEHFKVIRIGGAVFKRYSPKALDLLKKELPELDIDEIWDRRRPRRKNR